MSGTVPMRRMSMSALMYLGTVSLAGLAALALAIDDIAHAELGSRVAVWAVLALLTIVAGRMTVRLPLSPCRVSFSDAVIFLSVLVFGPALATLTGAIEGLFASRKKPSVWYKRAFNTLTLALSVQLSARLFQALVPATPARGLFGSLIQMLLPISALAASHVVLNTTFVSLAAWLVEGIAPLTIWKLALPWSGPATLAGAAAAALVFQVVQQAGTASFLAVLPFPLILYFAYRSSLREPVSSNAPYRG